MLLKKFFSNRYFLLSPVLIIYSYLILYVGRDEPVGDGHRYWKFAGNLLKGYYGEIDLKPGFLWSGPGYSIFLLPFKLFDTHIIIPTLFNAGFIFFGLYFFSKTLTFLKFRHQIIFSYLLILFNPTLFIYATYLYTEPLIFFLIALFIYQIKSFNNKNYVEYLSIGIVAAAIILTKVIFAYVFLFLLSILFLVAIKKKYFLGYIYPILFAFILCAPYQIHTYNLTNKLFYWSDAGGDLLYWISSPHEIDLGQWQEGNSNFLKETIKNKYANLDPQMINQINDIIFENRYKNHKPFLDSLSELNGIDKNDRLIKKAITNMKNNKITFLKNWILNTSRLFIGYPYSLYFKPPNTPIRMVFNIILSSFLTISFIFSIIILTLKFSSVDDSIKFLFLFTIIYLLGTSLMATQSQRFLIPITPAILFMIAYTMNKTIKIKND